MDPITAATAYATLVGLICAFKKEWKDRQDLNAQQFVSWLEAHHREDLKQFIVCSAELPSEIDKLLKQDTELILARLNELRDWVTSLPSRIDGLAEMIQSTHSRSDRLRILPQLIAENEKAVLRLEKSGLFLPRARAGTEWQVPIDVQSLRSAYERFCTMEIEDTADFSFLVRESARERVTEDVHIENRLTKRDKLLNAVEKLIALRKELNYLEEETRTRRPQ